MLRVSVLCLLLLNLGLVGCSSVPEAEPVAVTAPVAPAQTSVWNQSNVTELTTQWRGVPYRLGGGSKKGIDCSAFVSVAYQQMLGLSLPRTVKEQQALGKEVARDKLQKGDLIFFKTGRRSHHVGIYVGDDSFLHASTSQGVKVSSLDNVYWKARYWIARRL